MYLLTSSQQKPLMIETVGVKSRAIEHSAPSLSTPKDIRQAVPPETIADELGVCRGRKIRNILAGFGVSIAKALRAVLRPDPSASTPFS